MTCPDVERLAALVLDGSEHPELAAHLEGCQACQADLFTIQALTGTDPVEREISEALVSRIIAGLPEPEPDPKRSWGSGFQLFLTWVLGLLTALVSVVATGSIGSLDPKTILFLSMSFGFLCVLFSTREGRGSSSSDRDLHRLRSA